MISDKNKKIINKLLSQISYLENEINSLCHIDLQNNAEGDFLIDKIYLLTIQKNNLILKIEKLHIQQS